MRASGGGLEIHHRKRLIFAGQGGILWGNRVPGAGILPRNPIHQPPVVKDEIDDVSEV